MIDIIERMESKELSDEYNILLNKGFDEILHLAYIGTVIQTPKTLDEWHEDYGDVLWWSFPVEEPPYVGSPLWENWPGYHTHWTPLPPEPREDGAE